MERWIDLSEAERTVGEALDDIGRARSELVEAFTWGEVATRAESYRVINPHRTVSSERFNAVPHEFWQKAEIDWQGNCGRIGKSYREDGAIVEWDTEIEAEGIKVRLSDLEARWLGRSEIGGAKRGPKFTYDWDVMWIEACRICYAEGPPEKQSDMVARLIHHFGQNSPSESLIKSRVSKLYKALGQ